MLRANKILDRLYEKHYLFNTSVTDEHFTMYHTSWPYNTQNTHYSIIIPIYYIKLFQFLCSDIGNENIDVIITFLNATKVPYKVIEIVKYMVLT
jgi:hypothetical protein